MTRPFLIVFAVFLALGIKLYAQAPQISYTVNQTLLTGNAITIKPTNKGGAVPATLYGQVTTVAGNGTQGYAEGVGTAAIFNLPKGLAIDSQGNLLVADLGNRRIRKVTSAGVVSTFIITDTYEADDIATDVNGNLYVVDSFNSKVLKVTPAGVVSVIAGNGNQTKIDGVGVAASFYYPSGITVDFSGNLYISEADNVIRKITPAGVVSTFAGGPQLGFANGTGVAATFSGPQGMTTDTSGNIYVADEHDLRIRKITPGSVVSTFGGNGFTGPVAVVNTYAGFSDPYGVTSDVSGNIYVTDDMDHRIRKITPAGVVSVLAGNGLTGNLDGVDTTASFTQPLGIASDRQGNIYVSDRLSNLIRKIVITGYTISPVLPQGLNFDVTTGTISGTPTAVSPLKSYTITAYNKSGNSSAVIQFKVAVVPFIAPPRIAYPAVQTYVVGKAVSPLIAVNSGGAVPATVYGLVTTFAGNGSQGSANGTGTAASFNSPFDLTTDAAGNVYVSDTDNNLIRKITTAGVVSTFAGNGTAALVNGVGTAASFNHPHGLVFDAQSNLYVSDQSNFIIRKITPAGIVSSFGNSLAQGPGFYLPAGIAVDTRGNLDVAIPSNNQVLQYTSAGAFNNGVGGSVPGSSNGNGATASFSSPQGVALDTLGNIYVADEQNNLIRKITPSFDVSTFAGSGSLAFADGTGTSASFTYPAGLTIDALNNIYVADFGNGRIRKITPSGVVSTIAGGAQNGTANGVGAAAGFEAINGIAADLYGNLYVSDWAGNVIRKVVITGYAINPTLPPGLIFDGTTGKISGTPTTAMAVSNYTVTAYNVGGSSSAIITLTVSDSSKTTQTITFPALTAIIYGSADVTPVGTSSSQLPVTYTSSNANVATIVNGKIHVLNAGTTTITATQAGNTGFGAAAPVAQTLVINPAPLTIKADNKVKIYGAANPLLTVSYTGFLNGDSTSVFTSKPVATTTANQQSIVGVFAIAVNGAAANNYTISYVQGTLTINPATLTVTANSKVKTYGEANPPLTLSYTGFLNGDSTLVFTTKPTVITTATQQSAVGTYHIIVSGAIAANYVVSYMAGTLTVNPAMLTITANSKVKTYGEANPPLTLTYTGFLNGDSTSVFTTKPTVSTTAAQQSGVGNYPITVSGTIAGNYVVSYVAGTLTVNPATLTVTANSKVKTYGEANPPLMLSYTGFLNGDSTSVFTSKPTVTTTANQQSAAGNYPITASGAITSNYIIIYVAGTLTINQAALTITADSKMKFYSEVNPPLTLSYTGFLNGDSVSVFINKPVVTTTATQQSSVGAYPITVAGASASNYIITFVNGTLTIGLPPAPVLIAASPDSAATGGTVIITGTNFTGTTSVTFGGVPAKSFTVNSAASITAVVGTGATGSIAVTTPSGTGTFSGFVYIPTFGIYSFSPMVAGAASLITITGNNFNDVTGVSFGGTPAQSFKIVSPTSITAVVAAGSTGSVAVVSSATTSSLPGFVFVAKPTITPKGPTAFLPGDSVVLVATTGPGYIYQWTKNGIYIPGATSSSYTATATGVYNVFVDVSNYVATANPVNVKVQFELPVTNFLITTTSLTCKGQGDGIIAISAVETLNYTAQVTGPGFNKTFTFTNSLSVTGLAAGNYTICITIAAQPGYSQCFNAILIEPKDLALYAAVDKLLNTINLSLSGGSNYTIQLNGTTYTTSQSSISLPLIIGSNHLVVSTDRLCQGVIEKFINTTANKIPYPDPFESTLNVNVGEKNVSSGYIKVYSAVGGNLVYSYPIANQSGVITIDLSNLTRGVYSLNMSLDNVASVFKILKK